MKATGVVRKIDELGRVVIPVEVRRVNGWDKGQAMEMFVDDNGGLYMKAYQDEDEKADIIDQLEVLKALSKNPAAVEIAENTIAFIKGGKAL